VTVTDARGFKRPMMLPPEALPDCETCPKPELDPSNFDVLTLWDKVRDQVDYNPMNGMLIALKMDVVVAVAQWLYESGRIDDIDTAIDRVQVLSEISFRIHNAKMEAEAKANESKRQRS